jgi:flagellar export protein FliJ
VCALRSIVALRERQKEQAARELAAAQQARERHEQALLEAHARAAATPRAAETADWLDICQQAALASHRGIEQARATVDAATREVDRLADAHRRRAIDLQQIARIDDRRSAEARAREARAERVALDEFRPRPTALITARRDDCGTMTNVAPRTPP